jgi:galactokinase
LRTEGPDSVYRLYKPDRSRDLSRQNTSVALQISDITLKNAGDAGACRIHGGGFAGTTLNFVPTAEIGRFVETMDRTFGEGACKVLNIRPEGAAWLRC